MCGTILRNFDQCSQKFPRKCKCNIPLIKISDMVRHSGKIWAEVDKFYKIGNRLPVVKFDEIAMKSWTLQQTNGAKILKIRKLYQEWCANTLTIVWNMLSNESFATKIGVDTAENWPRKGPKKPHLSESPDGPEGACTPPARPDVVCTSLQGKLHGVWLHWLLRTRLNNIELGSIWKEDWEKGTNIE